MPRKRVKFRECASPVQDAARPDSFGSDVAPAETAEDDRAATASAPAPSVVVPRVPHSERAVARKPVVKTASPPSLLPPPAAAAADEDAPPSVLHAHSANRYYTTAQMYCDKMDRVHDAYVAKIVEHTKKLLADKPDESELSPEMKAHYEKFERMVKQRAATCVAQLEESFERMKAKFADLLEQQKRAQFPDK